jgi:Ni/Fe-hydrogenase subunit HybB-like protein
MAHGVALNIDVEEVMRAKPIIFTAWTEVFLRLLVYIGVAAFAIGLIAFEPEYVWGVYYVNLLFWLGLSLGGLIICCILQIVRATWAQPVRRIAEANASFLPYAFMLFLITYFGKEVLFPWARNPMPGREWWMQPDFVYLRFSFLFLFLFFILRRYVRLSLRSDLGVLREKYANHWMGSLYKSIAYGWQGSKEINCIQKKMSFRAPALILAYVVIYSLFAFEMVMGMDTIWYSNMFGGFFFVGNVYMGWAMLTILTIVFCGTSQTYAKNVTTQQTWDLGKLTCGFSILWGYLFFSQYLPQWYGNMPEETQWLLLRTRGLWMPLSYTVLGMSFIIPFVCLISEDIKKTPWALTIVCMIALTGVWLEKYVIVMPQLMPNMVPLFRWPFLELGLTAGFLGLYGLCIVGFMKRFPFLPVTHPATVGKTDW